MLKVQMVYRLRIANTYIKIQLHVTNKAIGLTQSSLNEFYVSFLVEVYFGEAYPHMIEPVGRLAGWSVDITHNRIYSLAIEYGYIRPIKRLSLYSP